MRALLKSIWRAEPFTPKSLVRRAVVVAVLFALSQAIGLREYTTFLSGTSANLHLKWQVAAILGCIHLLLYVGFILLVPIWLIAAGLLACYRRRGHGEITS
jgi:hypothetical protein